MRPFIPDEFITPFFTSPAAAALYSRIRRLFPQAFWLPTQITDPAVRDPVTAWWQARATALTAAFENYSYAGNPNFRADAQGLIIRISGDIAQLLGTAPRRAGVSDLDLAAALISQVEALGQCLDPVLRRQRADDRVATAMRDFIDATHTIGMTSLARVETGQRVPPPGYPAPVFTHVFNELFARDRVQVLFSFGGPLPGGLRMFNPRPQQLADPMAYFNALTADLSLDVPVGQRHLSFPGDFVAGLTSLNAVQHLLAGAAPPGMLPGALDQRSSSFLQVAALAQELGRNIPLLAAARGAGGGFRAVDPAARSIAIGSAFAEGMRQALGLPLTGNRAVNQGDQPLLTQLARGRVDVIRRDAEKDRQDDPYAPDHFKK